MSAGLAVKIAALTLVYDSLAVNLQAAGSNLDMAGGFSTWASARYYIRQAGINIYNASTYIGSGVNSLYSYQPYLWTWVDNNWTTGGEVTMDAIIEAMLKSSFNELQSFIGIVDAYRVALWNAPFNADFYAALARGFQKWP